MEFLWKPTDTYLAPHKCNGNLTANRLYDGTYMDKIIQDKIIKKLAHVESPACLAFSTARISRNSLLKWQHAFDMR